jgi:hypothetical protein
MNGNDGGNTGTPNFNGDTSNNGSGNYDDFGSGWGSNNDQASNNSGNGNYDDFGGSSSGWGNDQASSGGGDTDWGSFFKDGGIVDTDDIMAKATNNKFRKKEQVVPNLHALALASLTKRNT